MNSSIPGIARRFCELHAGFHLVDAVDAAVPMSWLSVEMLAQERKPLPVVDEFVLRLAERGINTVSAIAAVLGLQPDVVQDAVAQQLSAETVDYRSGTQGVQTVALTASGKRAATDLATIVPQRLEQGRAFDRLLWKPTSHIRTELVSRVEANDRGMLLLPSASTHDVTTTDVSARALNRLLVNRPNKRSAHIEILTVEGITKQPRQYLPAVLLIFSSQAYNDVRLTLVVDDIVSKEHDTALVKIGGADRLDIRVSPPIGEQDLPAELLSQRVESKTVRALQRRVDGTAASAPKPEDGQLTAGTSTSESLDSAAARAELDNLSVRSIPAFEHRELLAEALNVARDRFLLATRSIDRFSIDDNFISRMEAMLRRRRTETYLAYGLGHPDALLDAVALQRLEDLAHQYEHFSVVALNMVLPTALIYDDIWISSNFEWLLAPGGADRVFRAEEGTLVRHEDSVSKTYKTYTEAVKAAR